MGIILSDFSVYFGFGSEWLHRCRNQEVLNRNYDGERQKNETNNRIIEQHKVSQVIRMVRIFLVKNRKLPTG